jgi:hypothetical protein
MGEAYPNYMYRSRSFKYVANANTGGPTVRM